jgi:hypothetical protein
MAPATAKTIALAALVALAGAPAARAASPSPSSPAPSPGALARRAAPSHLSSATRALFTVRAPGSFPRR